MTALAVLERAPARAGPRDRKWLRRCVCQWQQVAGCDQGQARGQAEKADGGQLRHRRGGSGAACTSKAGKREHTQPKAAYQRWAPLCACAAHLTPLFSLRVLPTTGLKRVSKDSENVAVDMNALFDELSWEVRAPAAPPVAAATDAAVCSCSRPRVLGQRCLCEL